MDDLLRDFLTESSENLQQLDCDIVALERAPGDRELLRSIFRTIHTIKGTCGFLGLERLEHVAHAAENVLVLLREGELSADADVIGDVLAAVDVIRTILDGLATTAAEPAGDDAALVAALDGWTNGTRRAAPLPVAPRPVAPEPVAHDSAPAESGQATGAAAPIVESSLRVNVALLDRLMNMIGELVLTRNQLLQVTAGPGAGESAADAAFLAPVQQLDRVTTDLQETVMRTRMQPVGTAWTKLPRLVRDLGAATGKAFDLEMHGAATELDRQLLQAIQDPLTHMVRNAADHGIEPSDVRRAAGKPERGRITLNAYHEGGHVVIEVADDGAGMDPARVRRKAVERGLVSAETAAAMSDAHVLRYVFEPGFSTAAAVTSVSGRGVGMDVVKSNIERIGGTVDLASRLGHGCTVRVRIPLTLAIVPGLLVSAGGHGFAIPQVGVVELVRVATAGGLAGEPGAPTMASVQRVGGADLLRLRDALLPLVDLGAVLRLAPDDTPHHGPTPGAPDASEERTVVVCQLGAERFGVVVDAVHDTQEIVVKPVGRLVKQLDVYAGCTILGDGRVIMILDVGGLAERGQVRAAERVAANARATVRADEAQTTTLLLFDATGSGAGSSAPRAVPLAMVSRLEEVAARNLEFADGRWVVQYRGTLLPVLPASPGLDVPARDPRPVIVFRDGDRAMGLAVDVIHDIVDTELHLDRRSTDPSLMGVAVVAGRATEVLDVHHYLRQAREDWFAARDLAVDDLVSTAPAGRVLLVDDSSFFRGLVAPVVRSAGHHVVTSGDGAEALARLERGESFDLILSDIDMPEVNGFELASRVRAHAAWRHTPLVALTGRATPADQARAQTCGFDAFLTKFDRDAVLATVAQWLHVGTARLEGVR
ncbi:MAG TPA: chemotaxis protein CheW [Gemmatirosa sp.]